ncbi:DUF6907 domain-containing protein [Kitasatospora sp. NBC_01302]|uniref:DUF6907 domain-containing protein n=1 Tax=Kitasatospora sp. NBC_01302 TaxID=2903575 RepID=UPI002E15E707|nr:hypothetical protein OG294_14135 [Kitasatospora sp. NBC_01302]
MTALAAQGTTAPAPNLPRVGTAAACPAWCTDDHATSPLGHDVHHATEHRAVRLADLGGSDLWGLTAALVRYDPEPGYPAPTHEIDATFGGSPVEIPDGGTARQVAAQLLQFAAGLLNMADQLDGEATR